MNFGSIFGYLSLIHYSRMPAHGEYYNRLPHAAYPIYHGGTYYIQRGNEYEVVTPPLGAIVESIPRGYEKVEINGQTFYVVDGVQYKPILRDGEIWYEVIKSPNR